MTPRTSLSRNVELQGHLQGALQGQLPGAAAAQQPWLLGSAPYLLQGFGGTQGGGYGYGGGGYGGGGYGGGGGGGGGGGRDMYAGGVPVVMAALALMATGRSPPRPTAPPRPPPHAPSQREDAGAEKQPDGKTMEAPAARAKAAHCFVAINPALLAPGFPARLGAFLHSLTSQEPVDPTKPIAVPGDAERLNIVRAQREGGVRFALADVKRLNAYARRVGVDPLAYIPHKDTDASGAQSY